MLRSTYTDFRTIDRLLHAFETVTSHFLKLSISNSMGKSN